ncbi:hypothetical protein WMZ97_06050 [Lentibacillus sp. N15]|uniref:hypothetical protein n=1 Tax=Lentibacillus songyuanensis TaxID=3136161 RepID=UPI0031B9EC28
MVQLAVSGAGAGAGAGVTIDISPDEITTIYNQLQDIITELESNTTPNIEKLGKLNFYKAGKAKESMEVFADANEKLNDLYENYVRASTLVIDVLNKMIEADQAVAEQIIAKLEV